MEYSQFPFPRLASALVHPTRKAIFELLGGGKELSPSSISGKLGIKVANVAYHVDVLASHGAVEVAPGKRRGEQLVRLPQPPREGKSPPLDVSGSMRDDISDAQLKSLIETASNFPPGYATGS